MDVVLVILAVFFGVAIIVGLFSAAKDSAASIFAVLLPIALVGGGIWAALAYFLG